MSQHTHRVEVSSIEVTGRGQMVFKPRRMTPLRVRISATLVMPSLPGRMRMMRPKSHIRGGDPLFLMRTRAPSLSPPELRRHFVFC